MPSRSTPFRVLLVDQSQRLPTLAGPLFEGGQLAPSGSGCDYFSMPLAVRLQAPDVVVVDLENDFAAFAAIESVMAETPTPILVLHSSAGRSEKAFRALELGALDVAERPESPPAAYWRALAKKLALLAQIRVVKHVKGLRKGGPKRVSEPNEASTERLVAVASSLGGPRALGVLLRMLPRNFPVPICICQHISEGFTDGLATWLSNESAMRVAEAGDGDRVMPGTVFLAPSGAHLTVEPDGRTRLDKGPPVGGFKPSCDALLYSVAEAYGRRAIGVILTGMGKDGAKGLREIRRRGGRTIAQDKKSCVVYGMPGEAVEIGAAEFVLPLEEIAHTLVRLVDPC